jgi:hypothetical protein
MTANIELNVWRLNGRLAELCTISNDHPCGQKCQNFYGTVRDFLNSQADWENLPSTEEYRRKR